MGEIVMAARDLSASYSGLRIVKNRAAFNACGFGVRDRATETVLNTTYFCESYLPVGNGVPIKYVKFRISTGTATAGAIRFGLWYRDAGSSVLNPVDYVDFDKPTADWVAGTEYLYTLDEPIALPGVVGRTYYAAISSQYAKFDATDTGVRRGVTSAGIPTYAAAIAILAQTSDDLAVSFEAWGDPVKWDSVITGGTIEERSIAWEAETPPASGLYPYCTGDMTDPTLIIEGLAGHATSLDEGHYITIDLAAGQVATTIPGPTDFPDYATCGLRAVSEIELKNMVLDTGGIVGVLSSDVDSPTCPSMTGTGWTLLGSVAYVSATPVTLTISQAILCRWIAIVEIGTSKVDEIPECTVKQIQAAVTDGDFPVSFLNAYHKCWVSNNPIADAVYKVSAYAASGAESVACEPFTNRENMD